MEEEHSDTDCDLSQDVCDDLPDMFSSDEEGDEADARSRIAITSRYQRARLQEETGEEDRFESDSEGELCGRSDDVYTIFFQKMTIFFPKPQNQEKKLENIPFFLERSGFDVFRWIWITRNRELCWKRFCCWKKIPDVGSVATFQKMSGMANEFMETVKQFKEQATSSKDGKCDPLYSPVSNPSKRSLDFTPPPKAREVVHAM